MAGRKDILLDDNFNMIFENGDVKIGDSDAQHVSVILSSPKGAFREYPELGAGLLAWIKNPLSSIRSMRREVTVQLKNDGYKVSNFNIDENQEITLDYENTY